jgi:hypothetical protein
VNLCKQEEQLLYDEKKEIYPSMNYHLRRKMHWRYLLKLMDVIRTENFAVIESHLLAAA